MGNIDTKGQGEQNEQQVIQFIWNRITIFQSFKYNIIYGLNIWTLNII